MSLLRIRAFGMDTSTVGVMKRVNQLKEKHVIKHFTVRVDYEKLGLTTLILILIRLRPKPIKEFFKDMQCPELQYRRILSIFTIAHQYNFALGICVDTCARLWNV
jgi:DNA-binding Lrp family transcriptional regulator